MFVLDRDFAVDSGATIGSQRLVEVSSLEAVPNLHQRCGARSRSRYDRRNVSRNGSSLSNNVSGVHSFYWKTIQKKKTPKRFSLQTMDQNPRNNNPDPFFRDLIAAFKKRGPNPTNKEREEDFRATLAKYPGLFYPPQRFGPSEFFFPHGYTPQKTPGGRHFTPMRARNIALMNEGKAPKTKVLTRKGMPSTMEQHHLTFTDLGIILGLPRPIHTQETQALHGKKQPANKARIDRAKFGKRRGENYVNIAKQMEERLNQKGKLLDIVDPSDIMEQNDLGYSMLLRSSPRTPSLINFKLPPKPSPQISRAIASVSPAPKIRKKLTFNDDVPDF